MKIYRGEESWDSALQGGGVSIGNFDGVHLGHARLVSDLVAAARRAGGPSVVFTFDPHPAYLLRPDMAPSPLTRAARRAELLASLDVDYMISFPIDVAFLTLGPREFFDRILVRGLNAKSVVEGPNFFFGRDRQGDTRLLRELCDQHAIEFTISPPVQHLGSFISSSRVRKLLETGDVSAANAMLTFPYRITGLVATGAARGRQLGFPTANLEDVDVLVPAHGVYAGRTRIADQDYIAAIHIGPNPTFGERSSKIEVHVIGFSGDLYGTTLTVEFLHRVRDVQRFDSVDTLREQLQRDIAACKSLGK